MSLRRFSQSCVCEKAVSGRQFYLFEALGKNSHVDYSLTPAGNKFAEAVALLCEWAVQNKALLKQVAARGTH